VHIIVYSYVQIYAEQSNCINIIRTQSMFVMKHFTHKYCGSVS